MKLRVANLSPEIDNDDLEDIFSEIGFLLVVLFQLSSFLPIISNRYFRAWGLLALVFHFTTGVVLGIWFSHTALAVMFFLIYAEKLYEWDEDQVENPAKP